MNIKVTNVFQRNLEALQSGVRYIKNEGGSRSSKTYSLCQLIIWYCNTNPGKEAAIIRKTFPTLRRTAMKDFFDVLKSMDIYNIKNHNKTENIYTFPNGSKVFFVSADNEQKLRGLASDILWCNEANELFHDDWKQLAMRCTGTMIVDYNPSESNSFLYNLDPAKTVVIHSTYLDNPFITQFQIDEIEGHKYTDEDYYIVYALGKRAFSKENVYKEWTVLSSKPDNFKDFVYGLDFGYTHPLALVKVWYDVDKVPGEIFVEELIYESYLTSTDLISKIKHLEVPLTIPICSDYARPEIIADMKREGFYAINATKDVKDGINNVKTMQVFVHAQSQNIIKENQNYKYKKVNGELTEEVRKEWDDAMDAIRYAVFYIKKNFVRNNRSNEFEVFSFDF